MVTQVRRLRFGVRQCSGAFSSVESAENEAALFISTPGVLIKAAEHRRTRKRGRSFKRKVFAEPSEICIFVT
jgi:hypothetical protein